MINKLFFRCVRAPAFWLGMVILVAGVSANLTAQDGVEDTELPKTTQKILREGTRIESSVCECRSDGNRLSIKLDNNESRSLIALENLAAQRVLQAATEDSKDSSWSITGTVTEFQGRNYILLERVSRVSK
jgi:hypothetical protein